MSRSTTRFIATGCAVAILALGLRARANPCGDDQALADAKVVQEAANARTPVEIQAHLPALQAILDRAPATYPSLEVRGSQVLVRTRTQARAAQLTVLGLSTASASKQNAEAFVCFDTYPLAALLIGSFWNEVRRPVTALAALDRGYALQPDEDSVVTERGGALAQLHRSDEALAMYDKWLAENVGEDQDRARVLRARGFALTELGRLDEAETAYRASLELEPRHATALAELDYIAKLRAGAKPGGIGLATVPDAKTKAPTH